MKKQATEQQSHQKPKPTSQVKIWNSFTQPPKTG